MLYQPSYWWEISYNRQKKKNKQLICLLSSLLQFYLLCAAADAKLPQSCPTLCDPVEPTSLPCPWDSPGKNTGVGCHFLLQCMKVKSESEVAQSCPTLSNPMDCSLPGSSVHGIFHFCVLMNLKSISLSKLLGSRHRNSPGYSVILNSKSPQIKMFKLSKV